MEDLFSEAAKRTKRFLLVWSMQEVENSRG